MLIAFFMTVAAVLVSVYFAQPDGPWRAAEKAGDSTAAIPVTPGAAATASPSFMVTPAATNTPVQAAPLVQLSEINSATLSPTQQPSPTAGPLSDNDSSPAVAGDCDGKEVHVEGSDGKDVSVEVDCDKKVEGSGRILNSVDVDARTGGSAGSGDVTVDINIKNSAGSHGE